MVVMFHPGDHDPDAYGFGVIHQASDEGVSVTGRTTSSPIVFGPDGVSHSPYGDYAIFPITNHRRMAQDSIVDNEGRRPIMPF